MAQIMWVRNRTLKFFIMALLVLGLVLWAGCGKEDPSTSQPGQTASEKSPDPAAAAKNESVQTDLVINGNLEKGIDGWVVGSGWIKTDTDGNKYLSNGHEWQVFQIIPLEENATYTFNASTRKDAGEREARLKIIFFDKHAQRLGYYNILYSHEGTGWENIPAETIKVPKGTKEAIIYLLANGEKEVHSFDNISLVKEADGSAPVAGEKKTITINLAKERLINGSFDKSTGWSWTENRIKTSQSGNKYLVNGYNWEVAQTATIIPNEKYILTAKTRKGAAAGPARIVVTFLNDQGKRLQTSVSTSYQHQGTAWESIPEKEIIAPAEAEKAVVYLLSDDPSGVGTHHFDDISLTWEKNEAVLKTEPVQKEK